MNHNDVQQRIHTLPPTPFISLYPIGKWSPAGSGVRHRNRNEPITCQSNGRWLSFFFITFSVFIFRPYDGERKTLQTTTLQLGNCLPTPNFCLFCTNYVCTSSMLEECFFPALVYRDDTSRPREVPSSTQRVSALVDSCWAYWDSGWWRIYLECYFNLELGFKINE